MSKDFTEVTFNSHSEVCMTYDDLFKELSERSERLSRAFRAEATPGD